MRFIIVIFQSIFMITLIFCRCKFSIYNIEKGEFDPRLDAIFSNLSTACQIILTKVNTRTIYLLSSSSYDNEHPDDFKILNQLRKISAHITRTFSHLETQEEQDVMTCENEIYHIPRALIIAVRPNEDDLVNVLYDPIWSSETIFVVVVERTTHALRQIIQTAWKRKNVFRVAVISIRETDTIVRLFEPWIRCSKVRFSKESYLEPEKIGIFLTRPVKTLHGCELGVAMYERSQTAVILTNKTFTGQDGKLIELLSDKMNFTPRIVLLKGRMTYGVKIENGTHVGTFAKLIDGTADISLNGHFMKRYNCDLIELTRYITSDRVCLLTPKAGIVPPGIAILKSFQYNVWIMIIATYTVVVATIYWAKNIVNLRWKTTTFCLIALEIYRIMVGTTMSRRNWKAHERVMIAFCCFFSTVILNSFQGSLVTFLNTPMHYPDIDTFEDLIASDLPLRTSSFSFSELLLSDPSLSVLANRLYFSKNISAVENFQGRFAGFQRINVYNLKYFKDIRYSPTITEYRYLHTMDQCLTSYFISYAIPKMSPYRKRIDEIISGVDEGGLLIKWNDDSAKYIFEKYNLVTRDEKSTRVFSTTDLEVAFFVLVCGSVTSAIIFIIEIIICTNSKMKKNS